MGGRFRVIKFMIAATWNAPEKKFQRSNQKVFKGKSADDDLFTITAHYLFT